MILVEGGSGMITNIALVSIYVDDQDKARAFWIGKAGFKLIHEEPMGPDGSWIELEPSGGGTRLVIYPKPYMKDSDRMRPSIMFECDDIHEACERMKANGVEFLYEPRAMKWGVFTEFLDSEGYRHFLREKRKA
jgi:predicted enzyme related to lactoylglutathione lyase